MEKMTKNAKEMHIIGGITEECYDTTAMPGEEIARTLYDTAHDQIDTMDIHLHMTDLSGGNEGLRSEADLKELAQSLAGNLATKLVFWTVDAHNNDELLKYFRYEPAINGQPRKDIYLSSVSHTAGKTPEEQYQRGLGMVKRTSSNLALAYDSMTRRGMIIGPEEAAYDESQSIGSLANSLLDIAELRSHLTFTRSTVIDGEPVDWNSSLVYPSLREVVDYCVKNDAYKPFLGVTAGHFAAKIGENEFLTSRRKTDFRRLGELGLVRVVTDGPDNVIAYGSKPSVGGQSQRIVFDEHKGENCIVHFHCPIKSGSNVPIVSQREYECGSHECGQNTSRGLEVVDDGIKAVYLDNHGPNIVFHDGKDPRGVRDFISDNFDLSRKTGGYQIRNYS